MAGIMFTPGGRVPRGSMPLMGLSGDMADCHGRSGAHLWSGEAGVGLGHLLRAHGIIVGFAEENPGLDHVSLQSILSGPKSD